MATAVKRRSRYTNYSRVPYDAYDGSAARQLQRGGGSSAQAHGSAAGAGGGPAPGAGTGGGTGLPLRCGGISGGGRVCRAAAVQLCAVDHHLPAGGGAAQ